MVDRKSLSSARCSFDRTPAFLAAWYASSGKRSQPPNTMSSSLASGTNSCVSGEVGERHDLLVGGLFPVGALAEATLPHLGGGADRLRAPFADRLDARH